MKECHNSHVIEVDGHEYQITVIGSEAVISDFGKQWDALSTIMQGNDPRGDRIKDLQDNTPLFSFAATDELKELIFTLNKHFDDHSEEVPPGMDERITQIAEPLIRLGLKVAAGQSAI